MSTATDVTSVKVGDIVRYSNRRGTASLGMKVELALDCGDGVFLLIGQGVTLAGDGAKLRRVATFRIPHVVELV